MTAAGATTYQWDGANRLKSVNGGTSGSYGFDGNGKRVKKTEGGASIYYVYSSVIGSAVMEVASAGVQRAYVMNGGSVVAQRNPDGNFYWLHPDHLGSGRKMTNISGNLTYRAEFDPYGKLLYEWSATPNQNTKKFTGYERDAGSGLDYAQARMYSSEWGRFMSPDPKGFAAANRLSPKSFNRYSYVNGDPVNNVDPNGLDTIPLGFVGGINVKPSTSPLAPSPGVISTFGSGPATLKIHTLDFLNPNAYGITGIAAAQEQMRKANEISRYWMQYVQLAIVPTLPRPPQLTPEQLLAQQAINDAANKLKGRCLDFIKMVLEKASSMTGSGYTATGWDVTGATGNEALNAFIAANNGGRVTNSTTSHPNTTNGGTTYGTTTNFSTVVWYPEFFTNLDANGRALHTLHESLHQVPGFTDAIIANAARLATSGGAIGNENPSVYFNRILEAQCS